MRPHALPDPDIMDLLAEQTVFKARVLVKPQSLRKTWLEQALKNAELALARLLTESSARAARSLALASVLELDADEAALDALHIECFDISHTAGEATQASRSEEHTSELQSLMRISYAVFCLKKKT